MSEGSIEPGSPGELRLRALAQLTGRADAGSPRASSAAALGALYDLARSPSTAGEALALLHEIQVHQVEVELQDEELRRSREELEAALAHYVLLYDLAPFAYFTLDAGTAIREVNLAGARLLGSDRDALLGQRLDQRLTAESGSALRALLAETRENAVARTLVLRLASGGAAHTLHVRAGADTVSGHLLVAAMDAGAAPAAAG